MSLVLAFNPGDSPVLVTRTGPVVGGGEWMAVDDQSPALVSGRLIEASTTDATVANTNPDAWPAVEAVISEAEQADTSESGS